MKRMVLIGMTMALALTAQSAQLAWDSAANYDSAWNNGSNGGANFGAWALSGGGFGLGAATDADPNLTMDSAGKSFLLQGGNNSTATRPLTGNLSIGQTVLLDLGMNFDSTDTGSCGVYFQNSVGTVAAFTYENDKFYISTPGDGFVMEVFNTPSSHDDYQGFGVSLELKDTTGRGFSIEITERPNGASSPGYAHQLFWLSSADVDRFTVFNNTTAESLYANNFQIVPEPASALLIVMGLAVAAARRARRTSSITG